MNMLFILIWMIVNSLLVEHIYIDMYISFKSEFWYEN